MLFIRAAIVCVIRTHLYKKNIRNIRAFFDNCNFVIFLHYQTKQNVSNSSNNLPLPTMYVCINIIGILNEHMFILLERANEVTLLNGALIYKFSELLFL